MKIHYLASFVFVGAILFVGAATFRSSTTIKVVEHAVTDTITDVGATGDSNGDILTFANEVYDEANANKVGTDNGYCARTVAGSAWECFWTIMLTDGQITVEGPFYDKGDSVLAITGGTGTYAGARGEMSLHARNDQGTEYDFIYKLAQ